MIVRRYVQPNQRGNVRVEQHAARLDATVHAHDLESSSGEVVTRLSPQGRLDSILPGVGTSQRVVGSSEVEGDSAMLGNNGMERRPEVQVNSNPSNFPIPKLELPVFDETKPR